MTDIGILYDNFDAEIIEEPYQHTTYKLMTDELCNKLIDDIQKIKDKMTTLKGISQSRFKIDLEGDHINGFVKTDIWKDLQQYPLLSKVMNEYLIIVQKLYHKYYDNDTNHNSDGNDKDDGNNDANDEPIHFCIMIVHDTQNYEIGPHTDSQKRYATMVSYLGPCDSDDNQDLGLTIYKDKMNRHHKIWNKKHYSFDNFEPVKKVDYYAGSSVDFKVSPNSFHGVPKIDKNCERLSIQIFVYKKKLNPYLKLYKKKNNEKKNNEKKNKKKRKESDETNESDKFDKIEEIN